MLSLMRKHAGTWMIKIILGAIVIVFIFWGVGSWTSQRLARVALVNGETITMEQYRKTYNDLVEQARRTFGNNFSEELLKTLGLKRRALDQLIDKVLVRQAAARLHLQVSDQALAASIRQIPSFQTAGVFDIRRYQSVLRLNRLSPEDFEVIQRDNLLMQRLRELITGGIKVSDQEARAWYRWQNLETSIAFVLFKPEAYHDIRPDPEKIRKYFDAHKQDYKTEPKVKVRYLRFNPKHYRDGVTVSDDEISDYYENHIKEFQTPKTVEARHILIRVAPDAPAEEVARAKKKIEKVLVLARQGQDFAELAKKYSEGPSRTKGGYLGAFRKEAMVKPFADQAFSMKAGEISDPVRTRFGWHIIKVEKVNPAVTSSLEQVRDKIRRKLIDRKAKSRAYDEAEAASDAIFGGEDLPSIAAARHLAVQTTDFFTRKQPPKDIADAQRFAEAAFGLPVDEISDIIELKDGYYLLQVTAKQPARIPEFKTVRAQVEADWRRSMQQEAARKDARQFLKTLAKGETMEKAAGKYHRKPQTTGFFKRNDSIPSIGYAPRIAAAAFELSREKPLAADVLKGPKGFYVIRLADRRQASEEGFQKEKDRIRRQLLQQKSFQTFSAWLKKLKEKADITIKADFLQT